MKPYLLDTNVLGYFVKGQHPALVDRMADVLAEQQAVISAVTRAEVRFGQARLARNDKRHRRIDLLLDQLPTLPWTLAAAEVYGPLKARLVGKGKPIGEIDTQIAAHALSEGLVLVTHNTRHFKVVEGLVLEDWMP